MTKGKWKDSPEYQRILEILADYWLTEPDELKVRVTMDFVKANGETQSKRIMWVNPNYRCTRKQRECVRIADILSEDYSKREEAEFWSVTDYVKIK